MSKITVYSQNVGSDLLNDQLTKLKGMEEWTFENRIGKIIDVLPTIDVVALNEVYLIILQTFQKVL